MASATELTSLALSEAASLVRNKSVSPVELTRACLERIAQLNPGQNAFITVTADSAVEEARRAETEIQKLTDKHVAEIDQVLAEKEKELMQV